MNSTRRFSLSGFTCLLFLFLAGSAAAQIRTVLVSPVPGDPVASGTALRNALAGISSPSSTNRWLVKIEPGTYDIGTTSLPMRSWVDIEGSGIDATTIRGTVDGTSLVAATINGANNTELRLLTVTASRTDDKGAIAMYNENAGVLRVYRVKFLSVSNGGGAWAMRNFQSAPLIEECDFSATTTVSGEANGVVYRQVVTTGEKSSILRSRIAVWGGAKNYGVLMVDGQTLTKLHDSRIDASIGPTTYGINAGISSGWFGGNDSLSIRNTEISSAANPTGTSYGVRLDSGSSITLDVASSKIWAHVSSTAYAASQQGNAPMTFAHSNLLGATKTIESVSSVLIASTALQGGPVDASGWVGCVGVWDENAVFYANSCP